VIDTCLTFDTRDEGRVTTLKRSSLNIRTHARGIQAKVKGWGHGGMACQLLTDVDDGFLPRFDCSKIVGIKHSPKLKVDRRLAVM